MRADDPWQRKARERMTVGRRSGCERVTDVANRAAKDSPQEQGSRSDPTEAESESENTPKMDVLKK